MTELVAFYKENANILRSAFLELGFSVYGGANAPYVWVGFPGQVRLGRSGPRGWQGVYGPHTCPLYPWVDGAGRLHMRATAIPVGVLLGPGMLSKALPDLA